MFSTIDGISPADLFGMSCGLTACALFGLGAYSSKYVDVCVAVYCCPLTPMHISQQMETHVDIYTDPILIHPPCFRFSKYPWYRQGAFVMVNGATAAAVAYLVGWGVASAVELEGCSE
jgi:hypothetical protein